jgi:hypothetical protein
MQRMSTTVSKMKAPANEMNTHWLEFFCLIAEKVHKNVTCHTSHL